MVQALQDSEHIVDFLRPDKRGQARVFAPDGSEFTAGQGLWMRGQLAKVREVCARGDQPEAARMLGPVQDLIRTHKKT